MRLKRRKIAEIKFSIHLNNGIPEIKTVSSWGICGEKYIKVLLLGLINGSLVFNALTSVEECNTEEAYDIVEELMMHLEQKESDENIDEFVKPSEAFRD